MRPLSPIFIALAALWMTDGMAQEPPDETLRELLCEQCPFDAPVVPPRSMITPEMRNLGVVSVADMVNQLPNNIASVSPEATADSPFFLGASIANRSTNEEASSESESAAANDDGSRDSASSDAEESDAVSVEGEPKR